VIDSNPWKVISRGFFISILEKGLIVN